MACPPFSLSAERYDQSTYIGRLRRCFDVVDPMTLLVTSEKLNESVKLLKAFEEGKLTPGITDEHLWKAKKIKDAIIHPDTSEKIFMPFRMSGYVPFGTISVIGMLIPGASVGQVIFWQAINQTHNACVNYANRNASKPTPLNRFVTSYVGAVTSAVMIAVGISMSIKNTRLLSPTQKLLASRFVAYPATSTANLCNIYMMRQNELKEGVDVEDADGHVIGTSKIAAKKAVYETALSRIALPAPILIVPPIVMSLLEKTRFLRQRPRLNMPVNALVCTLAFGLALPITIALFPQKSKMASTKLEPELASKTASPYVYFNKGL